MGSFETKVTPWAFTVQHQGGTLCRDWDGCWWPLPVTLVTHKNKAQDPTRPKNSLASEQSKSHGQLFLASPYVKRHWGEQRDSGRTEKEGRKKLARLGLPGPFPKGQERGP